MSEAKEDKQEKGSEKKVKVVELYNDPEKGRAILYKAWKSKEEADKLFEEAKKLDTKLYPFKFYGRPLKQNRKILCMGDKGVKHFFGGVDIPVGEWQTEEKKVRDEIHKEFNVYTNFLIANDYPDGTFSIASHSDGALHARNKSVFTLSLGATRTMELTEIRGRGYIPFEFEHGDLFLMDGNFQVYWKHGIPTDETRDRRISWTYRSEKL